MIGNPMSGPGSAEKKGAQPHPGGDTHRQPPGRVITAYVRGKDPLVDTLFTELVALKAAHGKILEGCGDEMMAHRRTQERLETALALVHHAEKLLEQEEAASARLSLVISWIHHDLRTPLTVVIGYAPMLSDALSGSVPKGVDPKHLASRIERSGTRMHQALDMARDYLRLVSGLLQIETGRVDLCGEAADAVGIMGQRAAEKDLALEYNRASGAHAVVDQKLLRHALISLIRSSIACAPKGSTVTLAAGAADGRAVISVSDTGKAVTKEEMAFAFGTPEAGESIGETDFRGLGLVVARAFTERMGGTVSVESAEGKTTVAISFPLAQQ
jgi:signal transduction histidine kinase